MNLVSTAADIETVFDALFAGPEATVLRGGASEPLYSPTAIDAPAIIRYRADYIRSALHEVAHWCLAGRYRRALPDYGYWYSPDGRSAKQQAAFFAVERRPQALEFVFCEALDLPFTPSVDNLEQAISPATMAAFQAAIRAEVANYRQCGLPPRASVFYAALVHHSERNATTGTTRS